MSPGSTMDGIVTRVRVNRSSEGIGARISDRPWLVLFVTLFVLSTAAPPADAQVQGSNLPPVSGRSLSNPDTIIPADVLARVELLRENVEWIRRYMGKRTPAKPLLRVESAQPFEVYAEAQYLRLRANRLVFDLLREVLAPSKRSMDETRPADVFAEIDAAFAAVMLVRRSFDIDEAIAEKPRPDTTTPSEVFNAAVAAGAELNQLLDSRTSPSDNFQFVTEAVHIAASLHTAIPNGPHFPEEPEFEPYKTGSDAYARLEHCRSLILRLAESQGAQLLELEITRSAETRVTPNDGGDLATLVVEELRYLHRRVPQAATPYSAHYPGRRYPSHVYQRLGLLERILDDLVEASESRGESPGSDAR